MAAEKYTWDVLDRAHDALRSAVAGVAPGSWDVPTPCAAWNATQVLQHASGDQQGYAGILTGHDLPTEDPFSPSGTITASPADLLAPTVAAASRAFAEVSPDDEAVPVPLPTGPLPAAVAVGACALDAAVHAWDLAVATGQPSPVDDDLADDLAVVARADRRTAARLRLRAGPARRHGLGTGRPAALPRARPRLDPSRDLNRKVGVRSAEQVADAAPAGAARARAGRDELERLDDDEARDRGRSTASPRRNHRGASTSCSCSRPPGAPGWPTRRQRPGRRRRWAAGSSRAPRACRRCRARRCRCR